MTTTAEAPALPEVGSRIESHQQLIDLPVGSVISGRFEREVKREDGRWQRPSGDHRAEDSFDMNRYAYRVVSIGGDGTTPAVPPAVGSAVTVEQYTTLPVGTVIRRNRPGSVAWAREEGGWRSSNNTFRTPDRMRRDLSYLIVSLPEPTTPPDPVDTTIETPLPETAEYISTAETLEQYKQRFRTQMFGAQQNSGVNRGPVTAAMRKLGVAEMDVTPGLPVVMSDHDTIERLPDGTAVAYKTPDDAQYSVLVKQNGGLVSALGVNHPDSFDVLKVIQVPGVDGPPEWVTASSSESELDAIRQFMRQAWEVGIEAKRSNSWCGEYERAMERVGINENVLCDPNSGLTAEEVAALPEGTVLRFWGFPATENSVLYVRDDAADNPARTRRIGGTLPGSWAARGMSVVCEVSQPFRVSVASTAEMDDMPVGTVLQETANTRNGNRWVKSSTGYSGDTSRFWKLAGDTYGYRSRQFTTSAMSYTLIPGVTR